MKKGSKSQVVLEAWGTDADDDAVLIDTQIHATQADAEQAAKLLLLDDAVEEVITYNRSVTTYTVDDGGEDPKGVDAPERDSDGGTASGGNMSNTKK